MAQDVQMARISTGEYVMGVITETADGYDFVSAIAIYPQAHETPRGTMMAFKGGVVFWGMEYSPGNPFQSFHLRREQVLQIYTCSEPAVAERYHMALTEAVMQKPEPSPLVIVPGGKGNS